MRRPTSGTAGGDHRHGWHGPRRYFDIRFIDAMIPHHESAIMMAQMALQQTGKPEIKQLAAEIISAQTAEIEQMKQWRAEWAK